MNFDEEPEGDPHGECTAEIHKLQAEVKRSERQRNALITAHNKLLEERDSALHKWEVNAEGDATLKPGDYDIGSQPVPPGPVKCRMRGLASKMVVALVWLDLQDHLHVDMQYDNCHDVIFERPECRPRSIKTNDSYKQQTEKDWWGWGWKELSGKTSKQLEAQAKKVAATYEWNLSQERVIELLLKGKH